mmetsp:Transcript_8251/g.13113  ORF Transcript_8251/g.13113 Transcript_8251/m.13113 type:complete len:312 (+) Transcript_8251:129-1064(+)
MSRRGSHHSEQLRSRMLLLFLGTSVLLLCTVTGKHRQSLRASPEISTDRFNNTSNGTTAHPTAVEKVPLARLKAPVVIFGAELRIGTLIAIGLAERGERVVAMSRESEPTPDNMILKLAYGMQIIHGVDLKNPKTFERHFKRARAVIFASQARSVFDQDSEVVRFLNGDTPKMVEYKGVKSVVHAAVSAGVPRIVLLSMYMVTRTTSVEYKWLNKFKKAMYWKRRGEQEFIRLCKNSRTRSPSSSSSSSFSSRLLRSGANLTWPFTSLLKLSELLRVTLSSVSSNGPTRQPPISRNSPSLSHMELGAPAAT